MRRKKLEERTNYPLAKFSSLTSTLTTLVHQRLRNCDTRRNIFFDASRSIFDNQSLDGDYDNDRGEEGPLVVFPPKLTETRHRH